MLINSNNKAFAEYFPHIKTLVLDALLVKHIKNQSIYLILPIH